MWGIWCGPLWLREHSGLVSNDYMENLKVRPVSWCSNHRSEGEVSVLVDLSFQCMLGSEHNLPQTRCGICKANMVWSLGFKLLSVSISPFSISQCSFLCVQSILRPSLCNYKMAVRSSWANPSKFQNQWNRIRLSILVFLAQGPSASIGLDYVIYLVLKKGQVDITHGTGKCVQSSRLKVGKR